ncbi:hypothetical protein RB195_007063 [Necator americanus]|uniref:Uncharacterized protein n=1 Tax=Necator americanus TaxID=51031 RepID=A0ABR1BVG3_NECAM
MRDQPVINTGNCNIHCGDADEKKVETVEGSRKSVFYNELSALLFIMASHQVVIVGINTNAKMGLEQQFDLLGKWYYSPSA